MKRIFVLILGLVMISPVFAGWVSLSPPVADTQMSAYVSGTGPYGLDGVYTTVYDGTNWPADNFYIHGDTNSTVLRWGGGSLCWALIATNSYPSNYTACAGGGDPVTETNFAANYTGSGYVGTCVVSALPPVRLLHAVSLNNFWPTNGGQVGIFARGIASSNAVLSLTLNSNVVFQSEPTTVDGALWQLQGKLDLDTNNTLNAGINFSGQAAQFTTLSNFVSTNVSFTLALDPSADTNLTVTSIQIAGLQGVGGVQPIYTWPPGNFQTPYTVTNSTDSTFGFGAGLMLWDTNYIYVSWGTNLWRRAALSDY